MIIGGPFQVFLEEEWRIILDQMEGVDDLEIILKAIPELNSILHGKQFDWLIGKVIPFIFPKHMSFQDFKNCRLVSRRWKNAFEKCIEMHPDRRPYNTSCLTGIPASNHFSYHSLSRIGTNFDMLLDAGLENISDCQLRWNPFPGRHLKKCIRRDGDHFDGIDAVTLLKPYGHHVWYLNVFLCMPSWLYPGGGPDQGEDQLAYFMGRRVEPLLRFLNHLPNLKSLKISGWTPNGKAHSIRVTTNYAHIPPVPFCLDTLDLTELERSPEDVHGYLIRTLVNHDNILKLGYRHGCWNDNYSSLFPNLTELTVNTALYMHPEQNVLKLLESLKSPYLRKLRVIHHEFNICELLEGIEDLQIEIESLELQGYFLHERWGNHYVVSLPSIRDLKFVATPCLSFEFFEALVSLEYLTIDANHGWPSGRDVPSKSAFYSAVRRFKFDGREDWDNFSDMWEELPELQMLTIRNRTDKPKQYVRECDKNVFVALNHHPSLEIREENFWIWNA